MIISKAVGEAAGYSITGIVGTIFQPYFANATGMMEPLPWWGQLGVCGLLGFILWWTIARTIPEMSRKHAAAVLAAGAAHKEALNEHARNHREGMTEVAVEVKGLREDFKDLNEQQLKLLTQAIHGSKGS